MLETATSRPVARRYDSLQLTLEDFRLPLWVTTAGVALAIFASFASLVYLTKATLRTLETRMTYEAEELQQELNSFANLGDWWRRAGQLPSDKIAETFQIVAAPTLDRSMAGYMEIELPTNGDRRLLSHGDEGLGQACATVEPNPMSTETGMRGEIAINRATGRLFACIEQPLEGRSQGTVRFAADLSPFIDRLDAAEFSVLLYDELFPDSRPLNGKADLLTSWITRSSSELRYELPRPFQRWDVGFLPKDTRQFDHAWLPWTILAFGCITTALLSYISFAEARRTRVIQEEVEHKTAELKRSNEELERFAYAASHDLKAPLRAVNSLTEFVLEDSGNGLSEQSRDDLAEIKRRTSRMGDLLNGLLQYARTTRIDSETVEQIDTANVVRETVSLLDVPKGVTLDVSPQLPVSHTIKAPLELVFRNLISNACKHVSPEHGAIRIEGNRTRHGCCFRVIDNGPGIADEHKIRVFNLFERLNGESETGMGLGLALAKRCVEAHGGQIWIEDTPGGGATMSFTWPDDRGGDS